MKSQDTEAAARDLAAAAGQVPVVAAQNGVANERTLARWFDHVHGMCVMMPTEHLEPGVVIAHSVPTTGILDLGRHPAGTDEVDDELAVALRASRFECVPRPDIMRWKYRKLLNNVGNAVQALCGLERRRRRSGLSTCSCTRPKRRSRQPGSTRSRRRRTTYAAATISSCVRWATDRVPAARPGRASARGAGVETDFLNGEIALLGRLHGVPTPANARIQTLMTQAAESQSPPGSMTGADLLAALQAG